MTASHPAPVPFADTGPQERRAFAAVLALAFGLRVWGWSAIGIDHFDEGVYVFTGLGWSDPTQPLGAYPDQMLFAPPVFPYLVSLLYRLLGPSATVAIAVNVVLGFTTVAVVALVGRRWFGPGVGIGAAVLLAVDPLHVMLSRSALTDVAFLLLFLLGLAAVAEAFRARSWRWAVAAGLCTGIAWNTKYHGWFVLLIAGWGFLASAWKARRDRPVLVRLGLLWCVMAGVAALCYLPWALHVHAEMGYGSLLAYQRTNVGGTWPANLLRQVGQQAFLETPWSRMGPGLAALAVVWIHDRYLPRRTVAIVVGLLISGIALGQGATTLVLLIVALAVGVRAGAPTPVWLLAGWTALWLASAPLYDPYARLLLPLWAATALGTAWVLTRWLTASGESRAGGVEGVPSQGEKQHSGHPWERPGRWAIALLVLVGALAASMREIPRPQGLWRPSNGMEVAATTLTGSIPEGERVIVLGEPQLAFYLHGLGRPSFERKDAPAEIAAVQDSVFVIVGRYVRSASFLRENILGALAHRMERVDSVAVIPRDLRVLDDLEPDRAVRYLTDPDSEFDVILYRLFPADSS